MSSLLLLKVCLLCLRDHQVSAKTPKGTSIAKCLSHECDCGGTTISEFVRLFALYFFKVLFKEGHCQLLHFLFNFLSYSAYILLNLGSTYCLVICFSLMKKPTNCFVMCFSYLAVLVLKFQAARYTNSQIILSKNRW